MSPPPLARGATIRKLRRRFPLVERRLSTARPPRSSAAQHRRKKSKAVPPAAVVAAILQPDCRNNGGRWLVAREIGEDEELDRRQIGCSNRARLPEPVTVRGVDGGGGDGGSEC